MIGDRKVITGRYFNSNYHACAVVAVITIGIDWAAYMNGCNVEAPEAVCVAQVAEYGGKLSEADARHFFPDIELPYRR